MSEAFGSVVEWMALAIDWLGALVIGGAVVLSIASFAAGLLPGRPPLSIFGVRRRLGLGLVLALELLIAADLLRTLLRPSLLDVVVLGVIVVLRTILSLSLDYELRQLGSDEARTRSSD